MKQTTMKDIQKYIDEFGYLPSITDSDKIVSKLGNHINVMRNDNDVEFFEHFGNVLMKSEHDRLLKFSSSLENIIVKYGKLIDSNEKKDFLSKTENNNILNTLEQLLEEDRTQNKTFEILENYGIKNPKQFFINIGFDFDEKLNPIENNQKQNNKNGEINEDSTPEDLYKIFLTNNFPTNDIESLTILENYFKDLYNAKQSEINGWLLEIIKNDFHEVKKIIKVVLNSEVENINNTIKDKMFKLINQRSLRLEKIPKEDRDKNELTIQATPPFKDVKSLDEFITTNSGMPDVLYFPKNTDKELIANNISSWDDPNHSYSVFHHFYKTSKINDILKDKIKPDTNITKLVNKEIGLLTEIEKVENWQKKGTYQNLKEDLDGDIEKINDIFDLDRVSFTATINSSTLTVFQSHKGFTKDNESKLTDTELEDLKQVEEINTLIFFLSLIGEENREFQSKEGTLENDEVNKFNNKIIETIFSKINVGILSNRGYYTEKSNNEIEKSIYKFFTFITDEKTGKLFKEKNTILKTNKKTGETYQDYSDNFKKFIQKAVNYISIHYPNILVEVENEHKIFSTPLLKSLFSECGDEQKILQKDLMINKMKRDKIDSIKKAISNNIIDLVLDLGFISSNDLEEYGLIAEEEIFWEKLEKHSIEKKQKLEQEYQQWSSNNNENSLSKFLVEKYLDKKLENKKNVEEQIESLKSINLEKLPQEMETELDIQLKDLNITQNEIKDIVQDKLKESNKCPHGKTKSMCTICNPGSPF